MTLSADAIALLHCEADRLRSVAVAEGGVLPVVPTTQGMTPEFVMSIAAVGAYADTMWELDLLRTLGYSIFNQTYDALHHFVDHPDPRALDTWGLAFAALFAGAADRRAVPAGCGVASLAFAGLSPPDPRILPQNLPDAGDIPQPGGEASSIPIPKGILAGLVATMAMGGFLLFMHHSH